MNAFNALATVRQHRLDSELDSGEILLLEDEIIDGAFWQDREPEPDIAARNAILHGWKQGYWGATEAINALAWHGFLKPESLLQVYAEGVRALSAKEGV